MVCRRRLVDDDVVLVIARLDPDRVARLGGLDRGRDGLERRRLRAGILVVGLGVVLRDEKLGRVRRRCEDEHRQEEGKDTFHNKAPILSTA